MYCVEAPSWGAGDMMPSGAPQRAQTGGVGARDPLLVKCLLAPPPRLFGGSPFSLSRAGPLSVSTQRTAISMEGVCHTAVDDW